MTSCSEDFLNEEQITSPSKDYFKTQSGIDELSIGAYQKLKFKFNYVWAIECYNMGTDEFTDANNQMPAYNHYGETLNSQETGANQPLWDNYYGLVEPANIMIANVPTYYEKNNAEYNTRLGEGYFFRAYAYFELVKQFGGVPLKLTPSDGVETHFTRNSEEECYKQIIADFEQAYNLLPEKPSVFGRLTKYAAAHFLAKAHLFRASEAYNSWNSSTKSSDLEAVIKYGNEVVEAHPLVKNFQELWDFKTPDGANEKVSEVVLSAQFSNDQSTWGRFGNQMHLYYPSVYQNLSGCKRDISGDREFSYVSATEYTMQDFDRVNDSRFWKSFITKYGCNSTADAPTWGESDINGGYAPAGVYWVSGEKAHSEWDLTKVTREMVESGQLPRSIVWNEKSNRAETTDGKTILNPAKRFVGGDLGLKYIVNNPGDTRYKVVKKETSNELQVINTVTGKYEAAHTYVRYLDEDKSLNWGTDPNTAPGNYYRITPHLRSVALSKFRDGARNAIASQFGTRDAIIARSADDVLMVAEAYARKGDYSNAITYLNMVRDRAGYATDEDRAAHVDGGQAYKTNDVCSGKGGGFSADGAIYMPSNTYYESNNIAVTTEETKSKMHLNSVDDILNSPVDMPIYEKLKLNTDAEKVLAFILNERTRELIGESHRWEDLSRTRTLDARWHAFNDGVTRGIGEFKANTHYYRPIPQSFLDAITNENGAALSSEEKQKMQNPGY